MNRGNKYRQQKTRPSVSDSIGALSIRFLFVKIHSCVTPTRVARHRYMLEAEIWS